MRKPGIFFLLAIFIANTCLPGYAGLPDNPLTGQQNSDIIDQHYKLGVSLYSQGEYARAVGAFLMVLEMDPDNDRASSYISRIRAELEKNRMERQFAEEELRRQSQEEIVRDICETGESHMQNKEYAKAAEKFEQALRLYPESQRAAEGLSMAMTGIAEDRFQKKGAETMALVEAREHQESAAAKELREYVEGLYRQAHGLLRQRQYEGAEELFTEIQRVSPYYKDVEMRLAEIRMISEVKKQEERLKTEGYEYTLGPADVVHLVVKDQPKLSKTITIQPAGELLLPEVDEIVMVNGLTKEQSEERITKVLSKYILDVEAELIIAGYNSKKWYVIGEMGRQGAFPLSQPNLSLQDALYRAGLPVDNAAAMRKVKLIKPDSVNPKRQSIDVYALLYEGNTKDNVVIEPGDIIYVPKTALRKIRTMLTEVSTPVGTAATLMGDVEEVMTVPPVTREGSGPGQVKYKKYPWPWAQ